LRRRKHGVGGRRQGQANVVRGAGRNCAGTELFQSLVEALGGLMLVLGLWTRPLALGMAVYTILTAVLGHDFWNVVDPTIQHDMVIHFWKNVCIAGGFLLLFVTGAGGISVDAARAPKRHLL